MKTKTMALAPISRLIGTAIESYDFGISAIAASLVFGPLFFPSVTPRASLIAAYASFGLAYMARPFGGTLFRRYGRRFGHKAALAAPLLLLGLSTAAIGLLPTHGASAGGIGPSLLCLLRLGQGLALGGAWRGAVLDLESAPSVWRAGDAIAAPLGAAVGLALATGSFLVLALLLTPEQVLDFGWRLPFLASPILVGIGLWTRVKFEQPREAAAAPKESAPQQLPLLELGRSHGGELLAGTFGVAACFSLAFTALAFALGHGTATLGYAPSTVLLAEFVSILVMAAAIVAAAWLSDRLHPSRVLMVLCGGTIVSGIVLTPMLDSGSLPALVVFLAFALVVAGFGNGPFGPWLPGIFSPGLRSTGTSVALGLGGILGGGFSPVIEQTLADRSGLAAAGFYLALTGGTGLIAFLAMARRRALVELEQSEHRYRSIFEQSHIALFEMNLSPLRQRLAESRVARSPTLSALAESDPGFRSDCAAAITIVDANDAARRLLGGERDGHYGRFDRMLLETGAVVVPLLACLEAGGGRFERQIRLRADDGRDITIILVIAVPTGAQAADRVACAMIDITDREQAKDALSAAREDVARVGRMSTIGAVSASIAHEVNQPIGAMVMSAQACIRWLNREPPNIVAASQAAERAVRDGMRASAIVQRTREQALRQARPQEPVDLRQAVADVVALLDRDLIASGTTVQTQFESASASVLGDRLAMLQVLVNLVTNALQAMSGEPQEKRSLVIRIDAPEAEILRLSVRDRGRGIDPAHLARVFDPFFTTRREGIGIGLAICRTLVEACGGTLSARNHDEGGAIFELTLPILKAGSVRT